ncbi:MAG: Holliday junction resolvase RuvX [Ignavibacteriales bacterium]|nr:Holliday junction resolvase RuvX [Ignavibacteriales bacterium]
MEEKRVLGIDFGTRRIGLALSDPLRILATAHSILENNADMWQKLVGIIRRENVDLAVVGMPLTLKGERGSKAEEVQRFVEVLKQRVSIEVVYWDERFTTMIAERYRLASGIGRKARRTSKHELDAVAAAILLQGFLDRTKNSLSC